MKRLAAVLLCICCLGGICAAAGVPETSARAVILLNGDTGETVYAKNDRERLPMASTTKIMTALLLCEYGHFDEEITVTKEMVAVEGSSMGLLPGDRVTFHDLLYGMLLASGNDAANVTAIAIAGSAGEFAELMNRKAQELGLEDTHFVTPSGLDAQEHYTTAYDLACLARAAMRNEAFAKAAAAQTATLSYGNPPYRRTLTNHNKLLKLYDGAIGVKTGFTKKSGRCLVSAAQRDGRLLIAVTLNDGNDWQDHIHLLDYGFSVVRQFTFSPDQTVYEIPVMAGNKETVTVTVPPVTVNSTETDGMTYTLCLPAFLYAPLKAGDTVGEITYRKNGETLAVIPLTTGETASLTASPQSGFARWSRRFRQVLQSMAG